MPPKKKKSQINPPPDHAATLNYAARNLGPKQPQWAQYPDLAHTQPPDWRMQLQQVVNPPSPAPGNHSPSTATHPAPLSSTPISASATPVQATQLQSFPPPNPAMPRPPTASRNGSVSHGPPMLSTPLSPTSREERQHNTPRASPPSEVPVTDMPSNHMPDMSSATATMHAGDTVQFARVPMMNGSHDYPVERNQVGGARQEQLVTTPSPVNPPPSALMHQPPSMAPVNSMHANPTPGMSSATSTENARQTAQLGPMSRAYDWQFGPVKRTHVSGVRQQQPVTTASPVNPPPSASMHHINPVQNPAQQTPGIPMAQSAPTPVGPSHTIPPPLPPNPPTIQQAQPQASLLWFPVQQFSHALNNFAKARQNNSLPESEQNRMDLLQSIYQYDDALFLSIHQFYCNFTLKSPLSAEIRRRAGDLFPPLFDMLEDVLGSNKFFSLHSLEFFAEFPLPLRPNNPSFQAHCQSFVSMNGQYYKQLKGECVQRGFPPVVPELVHAGIKSVIFQIVVFKHIFETILSKQNFPQQFFPDLCQEALKLLNQNQAQYRLVFKRAFYAWHYVEPPSMEGIERNKECWRPHYMKLIQERVALLRRDGDAQRYPPEQMTLQQVDQPLSLQANPPLQRVQHNQMQQNQMQHNQMQQNPMQQAQMPHNQMQYGQMQHDQMQHDQMQHNQMQHNQMQHNEVQHSQVQQSQVQNNQAQHNQVQGPSRTPGYLHTQVAVQQREPHPERTSLHQAHVRSPILRAAGLPQERLYRYVECFIKPPARLQVAYDKVEEWTFTLAQEMISHIPKAIKKTSSASQGISVDLKSKEFHLRCIKWPVGKANPPSEHDWAAADTSWMRHAYFTLNGTHLQERRKIHHGKDKPIHVNDMLKAGENLLEITVTEDRVFKDYMLAVEKLGFMTHVSILHNCCYNQRVPPEQVKKELIKKLSLDDDDMSGDGVEILDSTLTIKVRDPIGGTEICAIPVRSKTCRHNECFDLETFLETRRWKDNVSTYDQWRCPYCSADARPQHLIVDGFMQDVRVDLERKDKMHIREIVFHLDGTWEPKEGSRESRKPAPIISLDN